MSRDVTRRDFVKGAVLVGAGAALGAGATLGWSGLQGQRPPPNGEPIHRFDPGDGSQFPIRLSDFGHLEAETTVVTAHWDGFPATVYKVPVRSLEAAATVRGYNTGQYAIQHPREGSHALLAYDARCTHLGCTVGWDGNLGASKDVPDYDQDGRNDGRILCPCHQAQFDIRDLGKHMPATPAPRPLPVIRMALRDPEETGDPELWGLERIVQQHYRDADRQGDGATFELAG